jgi:hypothetical protein
MSDIEKGRIRALSRGIGTKLFNAKVNQRYRDDDTLRDSCLVQDYDSLIEVTYKFMLFNFVLDNYTPSIEERLQQRPKGKPTPWMVLHFKFDKKFVPDKTTNILKPLGERRLRISHVDLSTINESDIKKVFDGFTLKYGNDFVTYNFSDKREIKLKHLDKSGDAITVISKALKFTSDRNKSEGEITESIAVTSLPKNTPKLDAHGLLGHLFKITFYEQQGNRTAKLHSIFISNNLK